MATITTPTSAKAWAPDITSVPPTEAIPDALINQITSVAGHIDGDDVAIRVPVVADDDAHIVPEGDAIPEANPDLSEALVFTTKVAKLLRLSREQFVQQNSRLLADAASRSIITKADAVLVNQVAPTSPAVTPPAGLLAQGITSAGAVAADLDVLVDALAAIATAGGNTTHLVLSPTAWASLRKFKTATGSNMGLLGTGAADAVPYLLGIPVLVNNAVPSGGGLAVDRSDIISAIGPVLVTPSEHAYFAHDSVGVRVTFRFGARVLHANRHAHFTVTAPV